MRAFLRALRGRLKCIRIPRWLGLSAGAVIGAMRRPEPISLAAFLGVLAWWAFREESAASPSVILASGVAASALAGAAGSAGSRNEGPDAALRTGTRSALLAAALAGCAALLASAGRQELAWSTVYLHSLAGLMPAMLAGCVAAAGAALLFSKQLPDASGGKAAPAATGIAAAARLLVALAATISLANPLLPARARPFASIRLAVGGHASYSRAMPENGSPEPACAAGWELASTRVLAGTINPESVVVSADWRLAGGVLADGQPAAFDLSSGREVAASPVPFPSAAVAFSPKGNRLFVLSDQAPARCGVASLTGGRFVSLPLSLPAVTGTKVSWPVEGAVILSTPGGAFTRLDLDSLRPEVFSVREEDRARHERAALGWRSSGTRWGIGTGSVPARSDSRPDSTLAWTSAGLRLRVFDRRYPVTRLFPETDMEPYDRLEASPDGSIVLRQRGGRLTLFRLRPGAGLPVRWRLRMPCGPEGTSDPAAAVRCLARRSLALAVYGPARNPLNGRTLGPDRGAPKAVLRFLGWKGQEAEAWTYECYAPVGSGDVLADVHAAGGQRRLGFGSGPEWWTELPDAAARSFDPAGLPSHEELESLRAAADEAEARPPPLPAPEPPANPEPATAQPEPALEEEIGDFLAAHHRSAAEGRMEDFARGFADLTDYLDNGTVSRSFIQSVETASRRGFREFRESVSGPARVKRLAENRFEASYALRSEWERAGGGRKGSDSLSVTLTLERQDDALRIVRVRSEPAK